MNRATHGAFQSPPHAHQALLFIQTYKRMNTQTHTHMHPILKPSPVMSPLSLSLTHTYTHTHIHTCTHTHTHILIHPQTHAISLTHTYSDCEDWVQGQHYNSTPDADQLKKWGKQDDKPAMVKIQSNHHDSNFAASPVGEGNTSRVRSFVCSFVLS